jgi:hypothetical protein
LIAFLDRYESGIEGREEYDRQAHEANLAQFKAQNTTNLTGWVENFRSVISYGQLAIKSAMLENGGAAVAVLAFIGNLWSKGFPQQQLGPLADAILAVPVWRACRRHGCRRFLLQSVALQYDVGKNRNDFPHIHSTYRAVFVLVVRVWRVALFRSIFEAAIGGVFLEASGILCGNNLIIIPREGRVAMEQYKVSFRERLV